MLNFERRTIRYYASFSCGDVTYEYSLWPSGDEYTLKIESCMNSIAAYQFKKSLAVCVLLANCHAMQFTRVPTINHWIAVSDFGRKYRVSPNSMVFSMVSDNECNDGINLTTESQCKNYAIATELGYVIDDIRDCCVLLGINDCGRLDFWLGDRVVCVNACHGIDRSEYTPDAKQHHIDDAKKWRLEETKLEVDAPWANSKTQEAPQVSSVKDITADTMCNLLSLDSIYCEEVISGSGIRPFSEWPLRHQQAFALKVLGALDGALEDIDAKILEVQTL